MPVEIGHHGIHIGGREYPLYSGSVHYWRHDSRAWPRLLDRVVDMGFKFICACVPWSVHETAHGVFDFGKTNKDKDLGKFLDLCQDKGLFVLVRPGPHVGGGLNCSGYPERILQREDILARTSDGTPAMVPAVPRFFPAPSYASAAFYEETGVWYDAVCEVFANRLHPDGAVVGVQVDSEMSLLRRTQCFDLDYCDAAVTLYHDFLRGRHENIEALNELYARRHTRFRDILPPREFAPETAEHMPYYVDWVEFKEFLVYYGINRLAGMLKERGLDRIFTFHNYPGLPETPFHLSGTEGAAVDLVGVDIYAGRADYARVRDTARALAGDSRLAFAPEMGSGCSVPGRPVSFEDRSFAVMAALMNGVKAVNHYMIADRDRWQGAPLARDGRRRPRRFDFYSALNKFLNETGFHKSRMQAQGALLRMRDYERFESLCSLAAPVPGHALGGLPRDWFCAHPPIEGLPESPVRHYRRQWRTLQKGFSQAGVAMEYADSDIPAEALQRYRLVVAPSFAFMNTVLQKKLLVYALKGGVLVLGPRVPSMDEYMRPSGRFASHLLDPVEFVDELDYNGMMLRRAQVFDATHPFVESRGKCVGYERPMERGAIIFLGFVFPDYTDIERVPHVTELARRLAARADIEPLYQPDDPLVETMYHKGGAANVLFAANPGPERAAPCIRLNPGEFLVDGFTGEQFTGSNPKVRLGPQSVRAFIVRRGSGSAPD
jgi:beta-galactosidase